MHLGAISALIELTPKNLKYILLNNNVHESVGGQRTVAGNLDIFKMISSVTKNDCISTNSQKNIIIYGRNYLDKTIYDQYNKLNSLGFDKVYLYSGGIFEWLLLQETFGSDMFETNYTEKDILKYRPK